MGTIIGILFIAGLLYVGAQTVKEGTNAMSEGSGCGCIFGVFMILLLDHILLLLLVYFQLLLRVSPLCKLNTLIKSTISGFFIFRKSS